MLRWKQLTKPSKTADEHVELHVVGTRAFLHALGGEWMVSECQGMYHNNVRGGAIPRLIAILRLRRGVVSIGDMVDYLYGDTLDGGPRTAADVLKVVICRARKQGFDIRNYFGRGYYLVE